MPKAPRIIETMPETAPKAQRLNKAMPDAPHLVETMPDAPHFAKENKSNNANKTKSLSKRLFTTLFSSLCVVILISSTLICALNYETYESSAEDYLIKCAREVASVINESQSEDEAVNALCQMTTTDIRYTYISDTGQVAYDSDANADEMENHNNRSEVQQARETQEAILQRYSETIGADTLYAAVATNDGYVVRLATTRATLAFYLGSLWAQLALMLLVVLVVAFFLSRQITRYILAPLQKLDISQPLNNDAYTELQPLLLRVDAQRKALEEQNKKLQQSVELRREFTGNVSHEMKTPLQVIGGYAELIENNVASREDIPKFAGLIRKEAETMRLLIDDVLTLSSLDESAQTRDVIDMNAICEAVCARLQHSALKRGIHIKFSGIEHAQTNVLGNASSAEQMVYNLVDNAIKYSDDGLDVFMGLSLVEGTSGKYVVIGVADLGCGIPDDAKARVFERFYRVDASRSRNTGGTGLGLAIVKHTAESFGGRVSVEDNKPKGTIFRVELPIYKGNV